MKRITVLFLSIIIVLSLTGCTSDYDKGYDEGYSEGYEEGNKDGYYEGYKKGEDRGKEAGMEEGLKTGYEDGQKSLDAYEKGFRAGEQSGRYSKLDLEDDDTLNDIMDYFLDEYPDWVYEVALDRFDESLGEHYYEEFDDAGMIDEDY